MMGLFFLVSHLANRGINITEIAARNSHRIRSKPCAARGTSLDLGPVHASQEHQAVHGIFSKKKKDCKSADYYVRTTMHPLDYFISQIYFTRGIRPISYQQGNKQGRQGTRINAACTCMYMYVRRYPIIMSDLNSP